MARRGDLLGEPLTSKASSSGGTRSHGNGKYDIHITCGTSMVRSRINVSSSTGNRVVTIDLVRAPAEAPTPKLPQSRREVCQYNPNPTTARECLCVHSGQIILNAIRTKDVECTSLLGIFGLYKRSTTLLSLPGRLDFALLEDHLLRGHRLLFSFDATTHIRVM